MGEKWVVSSTGYSIKEDNERGRVVAAYPASLELPLRHERFVKWLFDAERICEIHNADIINTTGAVE